MDHLARRDLFAVMGALAALGSVTESAQAAEAAALGKSKVFKFAELPVLKLSNGGEQRRVLQGQLTTGEAIEMHETVLPAGQMPHPPHKHINSEIVIMQTGAVEFIDEDGTATKIGPGDIIFTASNRMHGMKNTGSEAASYIVVSVGEKPMKKG